MENQKNNLYYLIEDINKDTKNHNLTEEQFEEKMKKHICHNNDSDEICDFDPKSFEEFSLSDDEDIDENMDSYIALEMSYNENFNKEQLEKIASYYNISYRKLNKCDLITEIVIFERDMDNSEIVKRRRKYWKYLKELKDDKFFSKYILWDALQI